MTLNELLGVVWAAYGDAIVLGTILGLALIVWGLVE